MELPEEKQIRRNVDSQLKRAGMTTQDVADALGITRQGYYKWLQHPYKVPLYKFVRIAEVIGCSAGDFFVQ